jgi:hypothetical protein
MKVGKFAAKGNKVVERLAISTYYKLLSLRKHVFWHHIFMVVNETQNIACRNNYRSQLKADILVGFVGRAYPIVNVLHFLNRSRSRI